MNESSEMHYLWTVQAGWYKNLNSQLHFFSSLSEVVRPNFSCSRSELPKLCMFAKCQNTERNNSRDLIINIFKSVVYIHKQ